MTKLLDPDAIARAMREAARLARHGSSEQRAGMFRPVRAKSTPEPSQKKAHV